MNIFEFVDAVLTKLPELASKSLSGPVGTEIIRLYAEGFDVEPTVAHLSQQQFTK